MNITKLAKHTIEITKKQTIVPKHILAARSILTDVLDRGGLKHEIRKIDPMVLDDMIEVWAEIIKQSMASDK